MKWNIAHKFKPHSFPILKKKWQYQEGDGVSEMLLINQEPRQSIFRVLSCDQLRGALLINLDLAHAHQSSFIHNCVAKFFINQICLGV